MRWSSDWPARHLVHLRRASMVTARHRLRLLQASVLTSAPAPANCPLRRHGVDTSGSSVQSMQAARRARGGASSHGDWRNGRCFDRRAGNKEITREAQMCR
ncbi:unnamed protein product [Urochloa humidicola]